jgi:hypothetical protein
VDARKQSWSGEKFIALLSDEAGTRSPLWLPPRPKSIPKTAKASTRGESPVVPRSGAKSKCVLPFFFNIKARSSSINKFSRNTKPILNTLEKRTRECYKNKSNKE